MPRSPILPMNTTPFFILGALWFAITALAALSKDL